LHLICIALPNVAVSFPVALPAPLSHDGSLAL